MSIKKYDMYTYILESKQAVRDIVLHQDEIFKEALDFYEKKEIEQIYLLGSGTSYHAAVTCKKIIEDILNIKVFPLYPMEFVDNEKVFNKNTLVVGISQAGRSMSTIRALEHARQQGFYTIAVTAELHSPILKCADSAIFLKIGEELAGPKTKGFIGSIATVTLFGLKLAVLKKKISVAEKEKLTGRMLETSDNIPDIAEQASEWYKNNAEVLKQCRRMIVLGYDSCMAAMLEGTLKVLEAVRYSVTGYELEEFMHGIYHSIDERTYLFYLGLPGKHFNRLIRLKEYFAKERKSHNYLITSESIQDDTSFVYSFKNDKYFTTMEYVVPLQVIARKLSFDLGIDCEIPSDPRFHEKMESYIF